MTFYTPIAVGAAANAATFNSPLGELDSALGNLVTGALGFTQLALDDGASLTIAAGVITITNSVHVVDTEGAAASDDLVTINGFVKGDLLYIQCANAARAVIVKHNTGNIYLSGGVDVTLSDPRKVLGLYYDGTKWCEIGSGQWTSRLNVGTDTTLTIAAGAVTATKARHLIDTEGAASADDLTTINGGNEGDVLQIAAVSASRVVTVKNSGGNIRTRTGQDVTLDTVNHILTLTYDGTNWVEQAGGAEPLIKAEYDSAYVPARAIVLPYATMKSVTGTNIKRAALMPSREVRLNWSIQANGSSMVAVGNSVTTSASATAEANNTDGRYLQIDTTAVANNTASVRSNFNCVRGAWNPIFYATIRTDSTTNNRFMWLGLFEGSLPGAISTLTMQGIAFRFVDGTDVTWKAITYNGTSQSTFNTGVNVSANTKYRFRVRVDSANNICYFSINDSVETPVNTFIPAGTIQFGAGIALTTSNAAVKSLFISQFSVEHD